MFDYAKAEQLQIDNEQLLTELIQLQEENKYLIEELAQLQEESKHLTRELAQLEKENKQLTEELAQTQATLHQFKQLLSSNGNGSPAPSAPTGETAIATTPTAPTRATATTPIESAKPAPVRVVPRTLPDETALDPDVVGAVRAIMDYNNEPGRAHAEKWAISFPVMKDLLKGIGKATQPKINAVFQELAQEIEDHHRQHALGERHNRVHKGQSITGFIRF